MPNGIGEEAPANTIATARAQLDWPKVKPIAANDDDCTHAIARWVIALCAGGACVIAWIVVYHLEQPLPQPPTVVPNSGVVT